VNLKNFCKLQLKEDKRKRNKLEQLFLKRQLHCEEIEAFEKGIELASKSHPSKGGFGHLLQTCYTFKQVFWFNYSLKFLSG
jgi:hypothetical protein